MDDRVGAGERLVQARAGGHVGGSSVYRIGPAREPASGPGDGDDLMARFHQVRHEVAADEPGCSDDRDVHAPTVCAFLATVKAHISFCYRLADAPTTAPRGMVVTPHPLATAAGVDALRAGGTAVDAAVAANAMLAVVYCNACGLGGDAFALVWDPDERRLHGFNGSGRSPAALTIEAVRSAGHDEMPARGPLTINVPGRSTPGSSSWTDSAADPWPMPSCRPHAPPTRATH